MMSFILWNSFVRFSSLLANYCKGMVNVIRMQNIQPITEIIQLTYKAMVYSIQSNGL